MAAACICNKLDVAIVGTLGIATTGSEGCGVIAFEVSPGICNADIAESWAAADRLEEVTVESPG